MTVGESSASRPLRTVFFGTPEFAVPTLDAMVEAGYRPALVVAQPSRPVGRGRRLVPPPVAQRASELGLSLAQPERVRKSDFIAQLRSLQPEVGVVVAFGQIFPRRLLEVPDHGCINVHASLLPAHRGAAPIQAAIAAGDEISGVCTMQMETGLDSGPVLLRAETAIGAQETAPELAQRLSRLGAELLVRTLRELQAGNLQPQEQDDAAATYAPRLSKEDAVVDWGCRAEVIYRRSLAHTPWPGTVTILRGQPLKLLGLEVVTERPSAIEAEQVAPGTLLGLHGDRLLVRAGDATIIGLDKVQRPGKRAVTARDLVNGERLQPGELMGEGLAGEGHAGERS